MSGNREVTITSHNTVPRYLGSVHVPSHFSLDETRAAIRTMLQETAGRAATQQSPIIIGSGKLSLFSRDYSP